MQISLNPAPSTGGTNCFLLGDMPQCRHHHGPSWSAMLPPTQCPRGIGFLKPDRKTPFNRKERFRLDWRDRSISVVGTNSSDWEIMFFRDHQWNYSFMYPLMDLVTCYLVSLFFLYLLSQYISDDWCLYVGTVWALFFPEPNQPVIVIKLAWWNIDRVCREVNTAHLRLPWLASRTLNGEQFPVLI